MAVTACQDRHETPRADLGRVLGCETDRELCLLAGGSRTRGGPEEAKESSECQELGDAQTSRFGPLGEKEVTMAL